MQFDKNIPLPGLRKVGGWPKQYFFAHMEVGDSQEFDISKYVSIHSARMRISKSKGYKFTVKSTGDKVRIWRIE